MAGIFEEAYQSLIDIKDGRAEISFLYMYEMTAELLSGMETEKSQAFSWRINLIRKTQDAMNTRLCMEKAEERPLVRAL